MPLLTEKDRESIALKRFSLIWPVLNGQVDRQKEYFEKLCDKPMDMPHYGIKRYSPKTLQGWLNAYRRGGIEALKPGYRSDRGKSRKVDLEIAEKIREKRAAMPRITLLKRKLNRNGEPYASKDARTVREGGALQNYFYIVVRNAPRALFF